MNRIILFFIALVFAASKLPAQSYQLVWSDEFNDTALNDFIWNYEIGNNNGWGNNESEYYTNNPKNVSLVNGKLVINALKENYQGFQYTSARIKTRISWKYGKIEAKMKLPYGQGIWPAFWMLGSNITSVGWPKCGEIDIMEMIGGANNRDNTTYGTAHWNSNGHAQYGLSYRLPAGKFSDDFHIFDIVWDAEKIIWHVDGIQYCQLNLNSSLNAFREPFFILLNLAVGGNWPGYPDNTTVFPQTMTVEYVRVYQITTDVKDATSKPDDFNLGQNYPNPLNPSTVIQYSIAKAGNVSLKIFDLLGREVAQLVNDHQEKGNYAVNFDASKLSAGVYIYSLTSGALTQSKKLMLLN